MSDDGSRLFKPSSAGMRSPTSNNKRTGPIVAQPRYPELGGFSSGRKGVKKNEFAVKPPK